MAVRAVWGWERLRLVVTGERLYVVEGTIRKRAGRSGSAASTRSRSSSPRQGGCSATGRSLVGPLEIEHVPKPREVTELVERLAS